MASFFKNLFRKENDSQPVPAASLPNDPQAHPRMAGMAEIAEAGAVPARSGLPQSSGGPFSAVSGRHMTARELAAFLPPALLRFDGVSPDQPVPLPVDSLRQSMLAGRPTLRLSQIQAACPLLFQRAPHADEDVEVTLPLARVKGILESSGPVPAPANPFEALPGSTVRPTAEASNPFSAIPAQGPPPLPPASQAVPAITPAAVSAYPFAGSPAVESAGPYSPVFPPPAGPVAASASPFVNLTPAALSPFAAEFAAVVPAPPAASPFAPAAVIPPQPGPPATPPPPVAASPFLAVTSPAVPSAPTGNSAPSLPFTPSAPAFPDLAVASSLAPVVQPSPAKAPSPFQVVHPRSFPAMAAPVGGGSPAPSVPISPMQPQPFSFPAATATQSAPVASVQAAVMLPVAPPPALQGFPTAATTQRPASVPWTPPISPASSANGAPLPILPRAAPAPASTRFGTDSKPVLPSGPPPVMGAAFPSPFQAVHPSPSLPIPVPAPVPVTAPIQVSAPVPAASLLPAVVASSPTAPVPTVSAPLPSPAAAMVELSLRAVLRDVDPSRLGFAPENVPEAVRVALPLDLVTRQLASGRVEVRVDDIRAGIPEKFRPAFARAVADLKIVIPMSEVFHNLPESAKPALEPSAPVDSHLSITTSPFQTPFAIKAEEDRKQLLDLSATGFDPAQIAQRPATQPIPPTELPPAPLPPVLPALSGAPTVQVELPPLRPAASAAPPPSADSAPLPRPGLLSRPPGSGTAPIPPRTAPRLKPVPISPTALRPFPKPPVPPEAAPSLPAAPTPLLAPPVEAQGAFPAPAAEWPPLSPLTTPVAPMAPPPLRPAEPDLSDDLGESFSAARLGAEPPPRAGSAPVSLPTHFPDAVLPSPGLETRQPVSLTSLVPTPAPALPVLPADEPGVPEWESEWAAPALLEPVPERETPEFPPVCETVPQGSAPALDPVPVTAFAPALEPALTPVAAIFAPVPVSVTGPVEDLSFGCVSEIRQLTLRAVLGTDQVLAPQDIVDRCASLAGLKACALFRQDSALVSQGMDAATAAAFRSSAGQTRDSLLSLADSLGLGSGGNFTLRTDHGVRSFFLEPGLCLAVWHEQPAFTPGTREKLILVTQELARD